MGLRNKRFFLSEFCFFVTTTCNNWYPLIEECNGYGIIKDSLNFCAAKFKTHILGYVIMPNHLHLILYFREENYLSSYMRDFKKFTSVKIRQRLDIQKINIERLRIFEKDRMFQVWEHRYDDVYLRDRGLLETKLDYIHDNPLQEKWKLVKRREEYLHSSAGFYWTGGSSGVDVVHYRDYF